MMILNYYTRLGKGILGDNPPTTKIYLSYEKEDISLIEGIANDILIKVNAIIYYLDYEKSEDIDFDELSLFISKMHAIFFIASERYLNNTNSYSYKFEYPYIVEEELPFIPIVFSSSYSKLFEERFGTIQYLNKGEMDKSAISYRKKLDDYLNSFILDEEDYSLASLAFKGSVFFSYRKVDRFLALEQIDSLHEDYRLHDVAIWYDEYLIAGEDYNKNLTEKIKECDVVVIFVTPRLLSEDNYVRTVEYVEAKKYNKLIIPLLGEETDLDELYRLYEGIGEPLHIEEVQEKIVKAIKKDDDYSFSIEEHFQLGLAYLFGVNVEINHKIATYHLEAAADEGFEPAIDFLAVNYLMGKGTIRDYDKSYKYQQLYVESLKKKMNTSGLIDESVNDYYRAEFDRILMKIKTDGDIALSSKELLKLYKKIKKLDNNEFADEEVKTTFLTIKYDTSLYYLRQLVQSTLSKDVVSEIPYSEITNNLLALKERNYDYYDESRLDYLSTFVFIGADKDFSIKEFVDEFIPLLNKLIYHEDYQEVALANITFAFQCLFERLVTYTDEEKRDIVRFVNGIKDLLLTPLLRNKNDIVLRTLAYSLYFLLNSSAIEVNEGIKLLEEAIDNYKSGMDITFLEILNLALNTAGNDAFIDKVISLANKEIEKLDDTFKGSTQYEMLKQSVISTSLFRGKEIKVDDSSITEIESWYEDSPTLGLAAMFLFKIYDYYIEKNDHEKIKYYHREFNKIFEAMPDFTSQKLYVDFIYKIVIDNIRDFTYEELEEQYKILDQIFDDKIILSFHLFTQIAAVLVVSRNNSINDVNLVPLINNACLLLKNNGIEISQNKSVITPYMELIKEMINTTIKDEAYYELLINSAKTFFTYARNIVDEDYSPLLLNCYLMIETEILTYAFFNNKIDAEHLHRPNLVISLFLDKINPNSIDKDNIYFIVIMAILAAHFMKNYGFFNKAVNSLNNVVVMNDVPSYFYYMILSKRNFDNNFSCSCLLIIINFLDNAISRNIRLSTTLATISTLTNYLVRIKKYELLTILHHSLKNKFINETEVGAIMIRDFAINYFLIYDYRLLGNDEQADNMIRQMSKTLPPVNEFTVVKHETLNAFLEYSKALTHHVNASFDALSFAGVLLKVLSMMFVNFFNNGVKIDHTPYFTFISNASSYFYKAFMKDDAKVEMFIDYYSFSIEKFNQIFANKDLPIAYVNALLHYEKVHYLYLYRKKEYVTLWNLNAEKMLPIITNHISENMATAFISINYWIMETSIYLNADIKDKLFIYNLGVKYFIATRHKFPLNYYNLLYRAYVDIDIPFIKDYEFITNDKNFDDVNEMIVHFNNIINSYFKDEMIKKMKQYSDDIIYYAKNKYNYLYDYLVKYPNNKNEFIIYEMKDVAKKLYEAYLSINDLDNANNYLELSK